MYKDSVYKQMLEVNNISKNNGYDYRSRGIITKLFSKRMFMNPMVSGFLTKIEPWFIEILDSVKKLQFYQNYTIDKNDGSINV